ncbi:MAG: hypothetical protein JXB49_10210 [Bacteroidales bacterium]|nr:hypothetical protein [Bacteroidales bacterium]
MKIAIKFCRKLASIYCKNSTGRIWTLFSNKEYSNKLISDFLSRNEPCMIARLGSTETACLTNYLGVKEQNKNYITYIRGKSKPWWWEKGILLQMQNWSGFFPPEIDKIERFCEMMLVDMEQVDILGSWLYQELNFSQQLQNAKRIVLEDMEPFFATKPWTWALEGKKVLVVHPFTETIQKQYLIRELLFDNNLLPEFELKTIKAVQSLGGRNSQFPDWFAALEYMKSEIDKTDYDIAIIGCGAYGFPLAAHIKLTGKKAIHLGGVAQLLFGIIGKRWEEYIVWPYRNLFNQHWIRPEDNEIPECANKVEGACYW